MSSEFKTLSKILSYLDREIVDKINKLSEEEKKVLEYFLQNISVGNLVALRELKAFYRVNDPRTIIRKLIDMGLIDQGYGCYNLSRALREALLKMILQQMKT
uniref:DUF2250 domain-containing protein n=1 Tax=Ignisphaera aggregans TaxID=334771 RepID=A0A7C5YWX2_9CREN